MTTSAAASWPGRRGDINAGRGSKTTVVTPRRPPLRQHRQRGAVAVGARHRRRHRHAGADREVPAGDVDLYAPLGTIDAGEAGIRVSGNINIHAQQVLNAANIKTGESVGVPVAASVTGALSSASAAASSAVGAAQDSAQRAQNQARQNQPSIISVQIPLWRRDGGRGIQPGPRLLARAPGGLPARRRRRWWATVRWTPRSWPG